MLKNISVDAKSGQKVAFVGSTGAGKTTITNLINRFYEIDRGEITLDGISVKDIKKDDLRRSMAMVLQDTKLFQGTIMENIRYGKLDATDEEVIEAAKLANAHSFIEKLPDGYETVLRADAVNISQGQAQLISIARAILADGTIMVMDEATSSVDTKTEQLINGMTGDLLKGKTSFIIAHRLSTVKNADIIILVDNGQIVEMGSHRELLKKQGAYYDLYTSQWEEDEQDRFFKKLDGKNDA